jgi:hypothetical protein
LNGAESIPRSIDESISNSSINVALRYGAMASEKTEHAIALVGKFPEHAITFLVREAADASLKQTVESLCRQYNVSIHEILRDAKDGLLMNPHQPSSNAPISPPDSLGSPGFFLPTPRPPTRSSLSGQSGFSSNHTPRPERIIALVAKEGVEEEYPLTMKRSSISTMFSFIRKDIVGRLGLCSSTRDRPATLQCARAPDNILRASSQCLLTWLRSTSQKTHGTHCLIVPDLYLDADVELGDEDYGLCAQWNNGQRHPSPLILLLFLPTMLMTLQ